MLDTKNSMKSPLADSTKETVKGYFFSITPTPKRVFFIAVLTGVSVQR